MNLTYRFLLPFPKMPDFNKCKADIIEVDLDCHFNIKKNFNQLKFIQKCFIKNYG